jgi:hypothetical protein
MLTPALILVAWTLVVWTWMYALRIPAMSGAGIDPDDAKHPGSLNALPSHVRAVADNYNHLHEQPTIFYALVFYTHLTGHATDLAISLAWSYVVLRILHSLVQNTVNKVMIRFSVFSLSSLALMGLAAINLLRLI